MPESPEIYLYKAVESLVGATSEYSNQRFNNCANRCYYAVYQAAIHALQRSGISPPGGQWGHEFVPARFEGELIRRRHAYFSDLRNVIERNRALREIADYDEDMISRTQAERALRRTQTFVQAIQEGEPRQ